MHMFQISERVTSSNYGDLLVKARSYKYGYMLQYIQAFISYKSHFPVFILPLEICPIVIFVCRVVLERILEHVNIV